MSRSQMILSLVIVATLVVGVGRSATPAATAAPPSTTAKPAQTAPPKKAVVLFSYQDDWWCVIDENKGIVEGLAKAGHVEGQNIEITRLYRGTPMVPCLSIPFEKGCAEEFKRIKLDRIFTLLNPKPI